MGASGSWWIMSTTLSFILILFARINSFMIAHGTDWRVLWIFVTVFNEMFKNVDWIKPNVSW